MPNNQQNDPLQQILAMLGGIVKNVEANRQGAVVVDFALLSFLVDAKIATIDQICQRISVIHGTMPASYQRDEVKLRLKLVTDWLRSHEDKLHLQWKPEVVQGGLNQASNDDPDRPKTDA